MQGEFVGIGIGTYDTNPPWQPLGCAVTDVQAFANALAELGFTPRTTLNPSSAEARQALIDWRKTYRPAEHGRAVVVLWASHGASQNGKFLLITRETGQPAWEADTVSPRTLAELVMRSGADQILLIIDACYAGDGLGAVLTEATEALNGSTFPDNRQPWIGVLASARGYDRAEDGLFVARFLRLLREGPTSQEYQPAWSQKNQMIRGSDILEAIVDEWPPVQQQQPMPGRLGGRAAPLFPNPRYRPDAPDRLVEHLVLSARGTDASGEEGWFFSGRRRVLGQIVDWLATAEHGAFIVTGPAGCGKSAVVGRIATLSDPAERTETIHHGGLRPDDPDPGEHAVDVYLWARNKTRDELIAEAAAQLGLPQTATLAELQERINSRPRLTIVLDALDEAAIGQRDVIMRDVVQPLSRQARVLVGTRNPPASAPGGATVRLVDLAEGAVVVDLGDETETAADVETYVQRRLGAVPIWARQPAEVAEVAKVVARVAVSDGGGFLFARVITGYLRQVPPGESDWRTRLNLGITEALDADLASGPQRERDGQPVPDAARELLTALAFAQGVGLPAREVWGRVASALSATQQYDEADATWLLAHYGRYVIESSEDDQAVYRLYHQQLVDHLEQTNAQGESAQTAVARALLELHAEQSANGTRPELANRYLVRHLAMHAFLGDQDTKAAYRRLGQTNPTVYLPPLGELLRAMFAFVSNRGWRDAALAPIQEVVGIYRQLAETHPAAYLPDLAGALNDLAATLGQTGQREEALAPIEEAVSIYRRLVEANPAAYLPDLGMALNNLSNHLSDLGQREEALAPIQEAVSIYRQLAEANPAVYGQQLAIALSNLADRLSELGHLDEAITTYESVVASFAANSTALRILLKERAQWFVSIDRMADALQDLTRVLHLATDTANARAIVETRFAIRAIREAASDQFTDLWREAEGGAPPDWAMVDRLLEDTVDAWYATPTWAASEQFFAEHAAQLSTPAAEIVLEELILLNPTHVGLHQHAHLLNLLRADGSADYRELIAVARIYGLLEAWIATPDWRSSRAFVQEYAEELLEPEVSMVLDGSAERAPDDREMWAHRGILALARQAGVEDAYRAVLDPEHRQERVRTLMADEDGEALLPYAYLQLGLGDDDAAAWADLAVASLFAGQPEQADQAIERCRAAVPAAQRTALVTRLATLAAEHPAHADGLLHLLGILANGRASQP